MVTKRNIRVSADSVTELLRRKYKPQIESDTLTYIAIRYNKNNTDYFKYNCSMWTLQACFKGVFVDEGLLTKFMVAHLKLNEKSHIKNSIQYLKVTHINNAGLGEIIIDGLLKATELMLDAINEDLKHARPMDISDYNYKGEFYKLTTAN